MFTFDKIVYKGNKILVVFLGNEFRNDDGIGPYISKKINNPNIKVIDAGQTFENYIVDIVNYRPTDIVIVDAAFFGGKVGEIRILDEKKLSQIRMVSTHSIPINLILDIIKNDLPDVNVVILGIQVSDVGFGENISDDVKKTADTLINYFNNL